MQTSLWGISSKAKQDKKYRFGNLYGMIDKIALYQAWKDISKNAAAGIDRETAETFKENLDANLEELLAELKEKRYKAKLVKRVNIPKGNGKTRPLGITVLRDKIVQRATASILEAIYEEDFLECSYGYRPGLGAQKAAKDLARELMWKYNYVVEADISNYFNTINHEWLMKMLKLRIKDKTFLKLINKWLKAGIMDTTGKVINPTNGCPQGSVISPILANIYLHYALDLWFEKIVKSNSEGEAYICRMADDFVCSFKNKRDAEKFYRTLRKRLGKFELELAEDKTKIIRFSRYRENDKSSFEFLGFEYRWKRSRKGKDYVARRTSRNKLRKSISKFKEWCKSKRNKRLRRLVEMLNAKFRGYFNYYEVIGNIKGICHFYNMAIKILYKWLNRRSQKRSFNWVEFNEKMGKLGLIKPRITETRNRQMHIKDFA